MLRDKVTERIPKGLRIRRRPQAILCVAVLVAIGSALSCTQKGSHEATVKMESNSPSGKYRCVVTEQLPPEGYYSPHLYTFTIRDALTNRDLKGKSYQRDTDSVSLRDLKFVWFDDELTVSLPTEPPRPILTAKFRNGEQQWTSLGN